MPSGTGITVDTPINLVVGAGIVLRDHAFFGASVDNNLFGLARTLFTPDLNGIKWGLLGTDYITQSRARIETTIPEVSAAVLAAGIPASTTDVTTPGMTVISEDETRRIPAGSYKDWELDVERLNGGQFQFEIDDAINTAAFEGQLQDDGLFAPRYTLEPRGTAGSDDAPWRIRILDVAS